MTRALADLAHEGGREPRPADGPGAVGHPRHREPRVEEHPVRVIADRPVVVDDQSLRRCHQRRPVARHVLEVDGDGVRAAREIGRGDAHAPRTLRGTRNRVTEVASTGAIDAPIVNDGGKRLHRHAVGLHDHPEQPAAPVRRREGQRLGPGPCGVGDGWATDCLHDGREPIDEGDTRPLDEEPRGLKRCDDAPAATRRGFAPQGKPHPTRVSQVDGVGRLEPIEMTEAGSGRCIDPRIDRAPIRGRVVAYSVPSDHRAGDGRIGRGIESPARVVAGGHPARGAR